MVEIGDEFDVSAEDCRKWITETYAQADKVRESDWDQYRKLGVIAAMLEGLLATLEGGMEESVEPEPVAQSLTRGMN